MKIPKRFKLYGRTITVEFVDDLAHEDDANGMSLYRQDKIQLLRGTKAWPRNAEQTGHTFCHELMHWILLHASGQDEDIYANEALVDACGALLHQALTTAEYK